MKKSILKNSFLLLVSMISFSSLYGQILENINVEEALMLIEDNIGNPNFTILDVRTPEEYNPEHIEGAFNRDFYDSNFREQLDSLHKERIYLIYCRSGNRSGQTFDMMKELGFQAVYNMLGGMLDWNQKGFPVTDEIPPYVDLTVLSSTTPIIDFSEQTISIYPNPFSDSFQLSSDKKVELVLTNSSGKLLLKSTLSESSVTLSPNLEKGIYFISIIDAETKSLLATKKLIKSQ